MPAGHTSQVTLGNEVLDVKAEVQLLLQKLLLIRIEGQVGLVVLQSGCTVSSGSRRGSVLVDALLDFGRSQVSWDLFIGAPSCWPLRLV